MRIIIYVLAFFCHFGTSRGSKNANDFVEGILNTVLQLEFQTLKLDPKQLPDFKTEFDDHVKLIGKIHGSVEYTDGQLFGLSRVRRKGECSGPYLLYYSSFINCTLSFDELTVVFKGKMKYGKLPSVPITAKANLTSTVLYIDIYNYPNYVNYLKTFSFLKIGKLQSKFTGLGTFNKYLNVLEKGFADYVWPSVFNAIGQDFQYALSRAVPYVAFPWY